MKEPGYRILICFVLLGDTVLLFFCLVAAAVVSGSCRFLQVFRCSCMALDEIGFICLAIMDDIGPSITIFFLSIQSN
jgi:hypothetical protein